jgi:hypothetical protein
MARPGRLAAHIKPAEMAPSNKDKDNNLRIESRLAWISHAVYLPSPQANFNVHAENRFAA